jgi:cyclic pyranopterin phosphate synthase
MNAQFTHLDNEGNARMVDVGEKPIQRRKAVAIGKLFCQPSTIEAIKQKTVKKGDVLAVARGAAIQASKKTSELIPLCHNINLDNVEVEFELGTNSVAVRCSASATAKTGVEMEALTGVAVAALTLYDMCKSIDKTMNIGEITLIEKTKK